MHDVDEDWMTISEQGGRWLHNTFAGITHRELGDAPNNSFDFVASKK